MYDRVPEVPALTAGKTYAMMWSSYSSWQEFSELKIPYNNVVAVGLCRFCMRSIGKIRYCLSAAWTVTWSMQAEIKKAEAPQQDALWKGREDA